MVAEDTLCDILVKSTVQKSCTM